MGKRKQKGADRQVNWDHAALSAVQRWLLSTLISSLIVSFRSFDYKLNAILFYLENYVFMRLYLYWPFNVISMGYSTIKLTLFSLQNIYGKQFSNSLQLSCFISSTVPKRCTLSLIHILNLETVSHYNCQKLKNEPLARALKKEGDNSLYCLCYCACKWPDVNNSERESFNKLIKLYIIYKGCNIIATYTIIIYTPINDNTVEENFILLHFIFKMLH